MKMSEIKDENLQSILEDESFIQAWANSLKEDGECPDSAYMNITISNDEGEKLIYNTEIDFQKLKGRILSKEFFKNFFHKDQDKK